MARVEDAVAAARLGADAVGLVFHPPAGRHVSMERAKQILSALPPFVTPVALVVNADSRAILDLADELRIRHVQLHGDETPQQVKELARLTVLKAIRVDADFSATLAYWRQAVQTLSLKNLQGVVLETAKTPAGQAPGGTGVENDWDRIAAAQSRGEFDSLGAVIAAGGLTPANVGGVVRRLHPFAVDVSSGIESFLGHKSQEKMAAFATAVRQADSDPPPGG
jgi:phosphoribosylanthranilate isomerase